MADDDAAVAARLQMQELRLQEQEQHDAEYAARSQAGARSLTAPPLACGAGFRGGRIGMRAAFLNLADQPC